jgi:hypothetical protein
MIDQLQLHEEHNSNMDYDEYDEKSYNYQESIAQSASTVYSSHRAKRKAMEDMLKLDSGYRVVGKKKNKIEYYVTNMSPGTSIRNAVTGIREYNLKVGIPRNEDQFFKIRYAATGITSKFGPESLYYDSPEQCERHLHLNIKSKTKNSWQNKYNLAISTNTNE